MAAARHGVSVLARSSGRPSCPNCAPDIDNSIDQPSVELSKTAPFGVGQAGRGRARAAQFAAALLTVAVAASWSVPSAAAAPSKVVTALVTAAQKEFDAGNFARAGDLFLDIWKLDKTQVLAIYNAARAYQLAGNLDKAEELFREMLALPALDAALKTKCNGQLAAIAEKRGEQQAAAAATAEKAGNYALAAQMWADALALQPEKVAWLLRLGRALQLAGNKAAALAVYDRYLAMPPEQAPGQRDAARWRAEIAQPEPAPGAEGAAGAVQASAAGWGRWPAYTALGTGAVGLAGGAILLALASGEDSALQEKFAKVDGAGHIVGMTPGQATAEANRIEGRYLQGWVVAGVGAAAAGVGAWLLLRKPAAAMVVVPTGNGVAIAVRL